MVKFKKTYGLEKKSPANNHIHTNFDTLWNRTCQGTVEKFNRVEIVRSNPHINSDKYKKNYDRIEWHREV